MKISKRQIEINNAKFKLRHKKIFNFLPQAYNAEFILNKIKIAKTLAYGSPTYENL